MLDLLDNPTFDNERNILNADLFVSNLKNIEKLLYIIYFGMMIKLMMIY